MRSNWIACLSAAGLLGACGGGGGSTESSTGAGTQLTPGPTTYIAAKATAGDYYTFKVDNQHGTAGSSYTSYSTKLVSSVVADGASSAKLLLDEPSTIAPGKFDSNTYPADYDSLGRWISTQMSCTQTASPPFYEVAPMKVSVGMSWEHKGTVTNSCDGWKYNLEAKDSALAMESVTVAAGTFNAIKVSRTSSQSLPDAKLDIERTCWWEPELGVEVKCVSNEATTNFKLGTTNTVKRTREMLGYYNQKLQRKADSATRFVGIWRGIYSGVVGAPGHLKVECVVTVDPDGNIAGSCGGLVISFDLKGKVSADGTLAFTVQQYPDMSFTGKFDSIQQMSGNWSIPNSSSGAWSMSQM
ncbi:MAG TPA: hypothetical protein VGD52_27935 [Pseudoduganella sp.]